MTVVNRLRECIRDVPDFPRKGILFRDLTPVLEQPALFRELISAMVAPWREAGLTRIAAVESRGFLFGVPMAQELNLGVSLVRKAGKLPHRTLRRAYQLEYGEGVLEVHADTVGPKDRVIIVDDLLATGGTAAAAEHLLRETGADVVGSAFVVELAGLEGRRHLQGRVEALLRY
ncbi:MAG: adenine phosphoribosyltransferase [Myxococcus sp.]|nr:adenine phosphoribosyltransferase [Myxococcus sp.]